MGIIIMVGAIIMVTGAIIEFQQANSGTPGDTARGSSIGNDYSTH
jgi:hypothetical protein